VSGSDARIVWVDDEYLLTHKVRPWTELPFWLPGKDAPGFFAIDCSKAIRAGLAFRRFHETVADTLSWLGYRKPDEVREKRAMVSAQGRIGLTLERERQLLQGWLATRAAD
jgi:2'-hydroxyisoflavone reductase